MVYNVMLVSAVQQNESTIHIQISPLFWISFPFRLPKSIKQSSLCYKDTVGSRQLSILYQQYTYVNPNLPSWQVDGETMETVRGFIFLGSKITADGDCRHEIKRHLLLGRKAMTNLDSVLKSRDYFVQSKLWFFPVVMYGCESWI